MYFSRSVYSMDFDKILSDLKNKVYHPVYFLMGEEPYFIDVIAEKIEKQVLEDPEKEFNQVILYGGETDLPRVIAEAKGFPMMSNYRVVIVKEAQLIKALSPKEKDPDKEHSATKEEKKNLLELYLENPQKSTILVFCFKYKTIDQRTSLAKALAKKAVVFKSVSPYDSAMPAWIEKLVSSHQFSIDPKACHMLYDFLGKDLGKIANELNKLFINLPARTRILPDHIQQYIGISKEYNSFELQEAIGHRDVLRCNRIANYFAANPKDHPLVMTVAMLGSYFSKLLILHTLKDRSPNALAAAIKVSPFFVKGYETAARNYSYQKVADTISLLREYDLKSKGVDSAGASDGDLLKEMIFRILH